MQYFTFLQQKNADGETREKKENKLTQARKNEQLRRKTDGQTERKEETAADKEWLINRGEWFASLRWL